MESIFNRVDSFENMKAKISPIINFTQYLSKIDHRVLRNHILQVFMKHHYEKITLSS
jgi:hypothetical protein